MILDCQSFETALNSCARLLSMECQQLLEKLRGFEFDALPNEEKQRLPYDELLPRYACGISSQDLPVTETILWFHSTRVPAGTSFDRGILPLNERIESIWNFLGEVASEWASSDEWLHFRSHMTGRAASLYHLKTGSPQHAGPYAFLVRDVILNPLAVNHNYLHMPEIIEDICTSYTETFRRPLAERVRQATRPCIVKFRNSTPHPGALQAALMYVHRISRGEDLFDGCNTCFDGRGQAIGKQDIVGIEWPQEFRAVPRIDNGSMAPIIYTSP